MRAYRLMFLGSLTVVSLTGFGVLHPSKAPRCPTQALGPAHAG